MGRVKLTGRTSRAVALGAAVTVIFGMMIVPAGAAPPNPDSDGPAISAQQVRGSLEARGSGSLRDIAARHAGERTQVLTAGPEIPHEIPGDRADTRVTPASTPNPGTIPVAGPEAGSLNFAALTHADSRFANNGNQFSGEPPDQALCVGNGFTFEMVNQVVTVYGAIGNQLVPDATINEFYGLAPNIRRTDPPTYGPFVFDPVCLYDAQLQRFFVVNTGLDQDPFTGEFTGGSRLYIAVSSTNDPTGRFAYFSINTTAGDTTDTGCPCFDDFPHVGADANGFFISTNRFSVFGSDFNGAEIHAISKRGLAAAAAGSGPAPQIVSINAGPVNGNPSFTVQPAVVPPGGQFLPREYFLSTLDFDTTSENRIAVWALANTATLNNANPNLQLTRKVISSLQYSLEPNVVQKPGPHPLGDSVGEGLNRLDSGSDMTGVTYADGKLWAATTTAVGGIGSKRDGVLWLQVRPTFNRGRVGGSVVAQGYVAVATNSVFYPTVSVNASGVGAMVMAMAGPSIYPSLSYISMNGAGVTGPVRVPQTGAGPEDGFTCYAAYVGSRDRGCRWGDYSAAAADENGDIWMATEWIPSSARTELANWGTYITRVNR